MPKIQGNIVFVCQNFQIYPWCFCKHVFNLLVQKYEGYEFFLWYDGPMYDRLKQIIPGLLNVVKKNENVVNRRKVECMF